jgi:Fe-Mn family superoxide dismutase
MTRRVIVGALAIGGATVLASNARAADAAKAPPAKEPAKEPAKDEKAAAEAAPAFAGRHVVAPLPFAPAKLKGISEKLIVSHHDNNYAGAVKNLNKLEGDLAQVTKDTTPFLVGGLQTHALTFRNSMILHEHYFGNLGGDGKASGAIEQAIAKEYGSFAKWEELFRVTGASLGGGSGWVVLGYDFHDDQLRTFWSGNHTQALAFTQPLVVMDMYEHAYQMDYGAAAAKYIDAFFVNLNWDEANKRLERARKASAALKA